ncbi:MAG: cytochrome c biogenesis protein ResB [Candidatus Sumerlaeaceae bacterium]|nr:cytochrome c biogenesis protein ResB [Candidatus Sumerlaeaceae bacterium]
MTKLLRLLSSVRLGIILIILITAACIYGSLIAAHPEMGVDFGREYVFHTPWFLGLMGLLAVNLILCSWEKSYIALTLYRKKNFKGSPRFYEEAKHGYVLAWSGRTEDLEALLKRRYTVTRRSGHMLYAQKGLLGRCGATIIHIGLLWVMAAGYYRILADDFGWGVYDGTIVLAEGETTNSYFTRINRLDKLVERNLREMALPFRLRALDFTADFHPGSTVARYYSSLVELDDGQRSLIGEISMSKPLLYRGYKITQNSYSANDRVIRGQFRVRDRETGATRLFDAGPGDPVRLGLPGHDDLFFETAALEADSAYRIANLATGATVEEGRMRRGGGQPVSANDPALTERLRDSRYALMIAALFPNFTFDEARRPITRDDKFENPAVFVIVYKNGQPNGQVWLFHNPQAQAIVGQPHPEISMVFRDFRRVDGGSTSTAETLMDYEIQLEVEQKRPPRSLGTFWVKPGEALELREISPEVLAAPAIGEVRSAHAGNNSAVSTESDTLKTTASDGKSGRFEVEFLGRTSGYVTFLGYMKDPSINWIYAGALIVIVGTLIAFLIPYREVWLLHDPTAGRLYMATLVRGTSPAAHREFDRLEKSVEAMHRPPSEGE